MVFGKVDSGDAVEDKSAGIQASEIALIVDTAADKFVKLLDKTLSESFKAFRAKSMGAEVPVRILFILARTHIIF